MTATLLIDRTVPTVAPAASPTAGMIGTQLREDLEAAGFTLRTEAGKLLIAPAKQLTRRWRDRIAANRGTLLRALTPVEDLDFGFTDAEGKT